jgi:DNA-binding LacI/PurR family transcriptional regulator
MSKIMALGIYQVLSSPGYPRDEKFLMSMNADVPIVLFNNDTGNFNAVYIDNYAAGQKAARCLLANSPSPCMH